MLFVPLLEDNVDFLMMLYKLKNASEKKQHLDGNTTQWKQAKPETDVLKRINQFEDT